MLAHRLGRWPSIVPPLNECMLFAVTLLPVSACTHTLCHHRHVVTEPTLHYYITSKNISSHTMPHYCIHKEMNSYN